jgi:hypothetical protein
MYPKGICEMYPKGIQKDIPIFKKDIPIFKKDIPIFKKDMKIIHFSAFLRWGLFCICSVTIFTIFCSILHVKSTLYM